MKHLKLFLLTTFFVSHVIICQNNKNLEQINKDVWEQFTKAFETSDYILFGSLHSEDLIRVGGDGKRILSKENYIKGYENRWTNNNQERTISFRFLERIINDDSGSERGIYKLTVNKGTQNEQHYYGKFHVILRKESGIWKILVDYDSSENNTINESSFINAFHQDDLDSY